LLLVYEISVSSSRVSNSVCTAILVRSFGVDFVRDDIVGLPILGGVDGAVDPMLNHFDAVRACGFPIFL